ncbi:MAG: hypothetical protein A2143_09230 [Gallionellales bacterium RBG_16_57_15]|nr:MAG: hypothetical protein A2143_09230 [Gallionellales bacterium RBG_16_57_15]
MIDDLGRRVSEGQIKAQDQAYALADDYEAYMKGTFRPVEKSLVDEAMKDQTSEAERLAGEAGAGVDQQFGVARANKAREMASMGINPNSGRWNAENQGSLDTQAAVKADSMNKTRTAGIQVGWAKRMDASSLGRNLSSNQAVSAGLGINAGTSAINSAAAGGINARANAGLMNQGFGGAQNAFSGASNAFSAVSGNQSKNAWAKHNADQENYQAVMNGIGTGYGMYKAGSK